MSGIKDFEKDIAKKLENRSGQGNGSKDVVTSFFTGQEDQKTKTPNLLQMLGKERELKSVAIYIHLKPSTHLILQKLSKKKGISKNEAVNQVLDLFATSV